MMSFRSLTLGFVVAGLLAASTGIAAQGPRGRGPFGPGEAGIGLAGRGLALGAVELSDAQRQQIREIRESHREQSRAVAQQLAEARSKLNDAAEAVPLNEGLVVTAGQGLAQAEIDAALEQARVNAEIWAVLTPDQQEQVVKVRADREARASEWRERIRTRRAQ